MKKRILTGDRPTGPLHLGHYIGSIKKRVELQDEYEEYILIADVQALTDNFENPEMVRESVTQVVLDYLAVGLDPNKVKFVIQSQLPALPELTTYYCNLVTLARLERNPTLKAEIQQKNFESKLPVGFLIYPISQAADITSFEADTVPVGADQLPMIEQTVEIVKKFNLLYGETLVEPKALLSEVTRLIGTDGDSKMSKTLGNVINLSDSEEEVSKKVMGMYTDPNRIHPTDPGKVEGNPVFVYHDAFNPNKAEIEDLKKRYKAGTVGDIEVKQKLALAINKLLEPMRVRRKEFANKPDKVREILEQGTKAGIEITGQTLSKVKTAMKIDYFKK